MEIEKARTMLNLEIDENLKRDIKIESVKRGITLREYVSLILARRHELRIIEEAKN